MACDDVILAIDDDPFADRTIGICNLKRRRLERARAKVITRAAALHGLLRLARDTGSDPLLISGIEDQVASLEAGGSPYAGAVRAVGRDPAAFGV